MAMHAVLRMLTVSGLAALGTASDPDSASSDCSLVIMVLA